MPVRQLTGFLKTAAAIGGVLVLVYFGARLGAAETRVTSVEARLAEEIRKAPDVHNAIETRTDVKIAQERELILSKLDDIIRRLDRIERAVR